jgi:hypothetical protein
MKLGSQTIIILNETQTGVDRLGVPTYEYTSTTVNGCSVQEHGTSRTISLTDVSTARSRLFAPSTAPLTTTSRVGVMDSSFLGSVSSQAAMLALTGPVESWCIRTDLGTSFYLTETPASSLSSWLRTPLYRADGYPAVWQSASGRNSHIECYLQRQEG